MIASKKVIEIFEKVIAVLENINIEYNWHEAAKCSCGIICQIAYDCDEYYLNEELMLGFLNYKLE
jgi:hypothetical protein